ncbi:hypothetical protein Tco_0353162 [Tanacetum coccineum]
MKDEKKVGTSNVKVEGMRKRFKGSSSPMLATGSYTPTIVSKTCHCVPAIEDSPAVPEHTTIYTNVDACQTAQEMWEASKGYKKLGRIKDHAVKNLALIAKCTSELYKLQTTTSEPSLNTRTRMVDTIQGMRRKPKRVKDSTYHKEKMLMCKQAEKVETDDSNVTPDSPDMCDNDIQDDQNDVECDDERVALANLIANLKLDLDEINRFKKQLKKANATLTQD